MPIPRNTLQTVPARFEMGPGETLPLAVNFARHLAESETIASASTVIERVDGEAVIQDDYIPGGAQVDDTMIVQVVQGIEEGRLYRLSFKATTSLGYVWEAYITIVGVNT